jgi:hypothetical protein
MKSGQRGNFKHVYGKRQAFKNYVGKPDMKKAFRVDGIETLNCEIWGYHGDTNIAVF